MTACDLQPAGTIELYFYGELIPAERDAFERHLAGCRPCRDALDELATIRAALSGRPAISAPPDGDWSAFMSRLDRAIEDEQAHVRLPAAAASAQRVALGRRSYAGYLAMAALLALVTMSVVFVMRSRSANPVSLQTTLETPVQTPVQPTSGAAAADAAAERQAFEELSEEHFERSKLVVLGLATKDAEHARPRDWTYERELASTLLADTRMYRLAAEDRGLRSLAGVMSDLEVVLLQTSLTDETDPSSLAQIQRLIHKRDLLEKMEVVNHLGLAP